MRYPVVAPDWTNCRIPNATIVAIAAYRAMDAASAGRADGSAETNSGRFSIPGAAPE
jgi:hypothetical protein